MQVQLGKTYKVRSLDEATCRSHFIVERTSDFPDVYEGRLFYVGSEDTVLTTVRGDGRFVNLAAVLEEGPAPCVAHAECDEQMQTVDVQALAREEAGEKIEELIVTSAYKAAVDEVNRPNHYLAGDIECIDAIRAALTPEEFRGYCKGNMLKYIWRERHKQGDVSIEKAIWFGDELLGKAHD